MATISSHMTGNFDTHFSSTDNFHIQWVPYGEMQIFLLILIMVVCSGCNKHFKKLHGLSLHRNKCVSVQSGSSFKKTFKDLKSFCEQTMALKFRERLENEPISHSDSQEIDQPDLVKFSKSK